MVIPGFILLCKTLFLFFLICRVVGMKTESIAYSGIQKMTAYIVVQMISILWSGVYRHAK